MWDVLEGDRRFLYIPSDILKAGAGGPVKIAPYLQPKLDAPAPYASQSRLPYELTWDLLTLLGKHLSLKDVTIPIFMQSSREDHIAPCASVHKSAQAFGGPHERPGTQSSL